MGHCVEEVFSPIQANVGESECVGVVVACDFGIFTALHGKEESPNSKLADALIKFRDGGFVKMTVERAGKSFLAMS